MPRHGTPKRPALTRAINDLLAEAKLPCQCRSCADARDRARFNAMPPIAPPLPPAPGYENEA